MRPEDMNVVNLMLIGFIVVVSLWGWVTIWNIFRKKK
jgi:hypothetical protein